MGRTFDAEEMLAIREQYEERIAEVEARREELEWEVRRVLAVVRDAELRARSAADEIERVYGSLRRLVEGGDAHAVTPSSPRAAVSGVIAPKSVPTVKPVAPKPSPSKPAVSTREVAAPTREVAAPTQRSFVATKTAALLVDDEVTKVRAPGEPAAADEHTAVEPPSALRDRDTTDVDAAAKLVGKKLDETPVKVMRRPAGAPPPIPSTKPSSSSSSSPSPALRTPIAPRVSAFADDKNTDVMGVRPSKAPSPSKPLLGYRRLVA